MDIYSEADPHPDLDALLGMRCNQGTSQDSNGSLELNRVDEGLNQDWDEHSDTIEETTQSTGPEPDKGDCREAVGVVD